MNAGKHLMELLVNIDNSSFSISLENMNGDTTLRSIKSRWDVSPSPPLKEMISIENYLRCHFKLFIRHQTVITNMKPKSTMLKNSL